jgi:hypothetical protein
MAISDSKITDQFAVYNGDCVEVMRQLPGESIGLSVYSPPFAGLYTYSSDARDMSNAIDKDEFFVHYGYCIDEISRLTQPGRISAVHCMDIPLSNAGCDAMYDLPGEIIRRHLERGFDYGGRRMIWKEPLMVRNRTMMKSLHHKTFCEDTTRCSIANADYLLMFRKRGENKMPVLKENGILDYAGENKMPDDIKHLRGMVGDQKTNSYSQWIWRQYASSVWMDIRIDRVLNIEESRDLEDEKHVHPLQLDVIERAVEMWSNPNEIVLTPFMGVGSEVYGAVKLGRKGIGCELKPSYYRQAVKNLEALSIERPSENQDMLFALDELDS